MGWKDIFRRREKDQAPEPEPVPAQEEPEQAPAEPEPGPDFTDVDLAGALALADQGTLAPLYMMPLRFGGEKTDRNRLWVPPVTVALKRRCDDMIEDLLRQEKVNGYECRPEYLGKSFVPVSVTVIAKMDGEPVFTECIRIWGKEG